MDTPTTLTRPFTIVNNKFIIEKHETFLPRKCEVKITTVDIENLEALYVVGRRKVQLGNSKKSQVKMILPKEKLERDRWTYDSLLDLSLETFDINANMVKDFVESHFFKGLKIGCFN